MGITRINHFEANVGDEKKLCEFMQNVVAAVSKAEGCQSCQLLVGVENSALLAVVEVWESVAHHQAAANIIPKEQIAGAMAYFAKPPYGIYFQSV